MGAIIIAAIITVGVVALLFVVNSRLNRRSRELEDYPKSLLGRRRVVPGRIWRELKRFAPFR